jgi:hypothetical protein
MDFKPGSNKSCKLNPLKKKKEKQKTKIGLLLHPLFYFSVPQRPVLFCFRRLVVLGSISILSLLYLS